MKRIINGLLFGKDAKLSGMIALSVVAVIALGCTCGKDFDLSNLGSNSNSSRTASNDAPFGDTTDDSGLPSDSALKALVNETTADFSEAISDSDFSKIYEKASMDFQSTYTQSQMEDVFKEFTKNKRVVAPILQKATSMEPDFSSKPYIRTEKGLSILVANGKYATKPVPTNFEYEYVKRNGDWKLLKLIVKLQ